MEEVTVMVIKVDLKCCKCYKKVKKILCKIPQIQDQVYDEKQNTVTIKVVCSCSPEEMMQKIRCKGGKSIISIEIRPPPCKKKKDEGTESKKESGPKRGTPPTEVVIKLSHPPPEGFPPGCSYPVPSGVCCRECSEGRSGGPCEQLACGRPPCYGGYCGRPVCDRWGGGCACGCNRDYYCRNRYGYYYYCEENPSGCSFM